MATPPRPPSSAPKYLREGLPKQDSETLDDLRDYIDRLLEYRVPDRSDLPDETEPVERGKNGWLVEEKVVCGTDTCKCVSRVKEDMHGPYLYRYTREDGELSKEYVGKPADY